MIAQMSTEREERQHGASMVVTISGVGTFRAGATEITGHTVDRIVDELAMRIKEQIPRPARDHIAE